MLEDLKRWCDRPMKPTESIKARDRLNVNSELCLWQERCYSKSALPSPSALYWGFGTWSYSWPQLDSCRERLDQMIARQKKNINFEVPSATVARTILSTSSQILLVLSEICRYPNNTEEWLEHYRHESPISLVCDASGTGVDRAVLYSQHMAQSVT